MDIPLVLAVLRPGQLWGPCAQTHSTYEEFAATWPGPTIVPTEAEMETVWSKIQPELAAKQKKKNDELADALLLNESRQDPILSLIRRLEKRIETLEKRN